MSPHSNIHSNRWFWFVGLACFLVHAGLIAHHTYYSASRQNSRSFPIRKGATLENWHNFLDLNRWDSGHYESIVVQGYRDPLHPGKPRENIQWYPVYPLIAKGIHLMTGWRVTLVFSLLSAVFSLAFWVLLWSPVARKVFGNKVVGITSIMVICWPGAYFWFAGMTEPMVAFLLLSLILLWFRGHFGAATAILGLGTGVKSVFMAVAIAVASMEAIAKRPPWIHLAVKAGLATTGFTLYGTYCWYHFGNFFMPTDMAADVYGKKVSLLAIFDIIHYAKHIWQFNGMAAFAAMFFLLLAALRYIPPAIQEMGTYRFFGGPWQNLSLPLALWWTALAYSAFCMAGDAYARFPFMSMLRYQTVNIPLFLLIAMQLRAYPWWKLILLMAPVSGLFLFWQNIFTVRYWAWQWVS
ncbi:MAG: hypothetical protein JEZ11_02870 [Desulfobacterales bacterium]|nr:hypothetical protein [Desulfobacterales bacterium]